MCFKTEKEDTPAHKTKLNILKQEAKKTNTKSRNRKQTSKTNIEPTLTQNTSIAGKTMLSEQTETKTTKANKQNKKL